MIYNGEMKVAIISAYHGETLDTIRRCHDSVLAQTHKADHILIGDGRSHDTLDDLDCQHVRLPEAHSDYGDTPRAIGTVMAFTQGYTHLCWLDADNWLEPSHVEAALTVSETSVVTMPRHLHWPDGRPLGICNESNGYQFNDTNCYLVPRRFMHLGMAWAFKPEGYDSAVGDRFVWDTFAREATIARSEKATINYTTTIAMHYLQRGLVPPPEAKVLVKQGDSPFVAMPYTTYLQLTGQA